RKARTREAVAGDDGRESTRQQQRLIADRGEPMHARVDLKRPLEATAIAAGQKERDFASLGEERRNREGGRRLSGAAQGEVADADDGLAWTFACLRKPSVGDRAIGNGER